MGRESISDSRNQLETFDALAPDETEECCRIEQHRTRAGYERAAGRERPDPVASEDVEGKSCRLQVTHRREPERIGGLPCTCRRDQATVRDHDALGPPGTSGSEDEVGEIVGMDLDRRDCPDHPRLSIRQAYGSQSCSRKPPQLCRANVPRSPGPSPRIPRVSQRLDPSDARGRAVGRLLLLSEHPELRSLAKANLRGKAQPRSRASRSARASDGPANWLID